MLVQKIFDAEGESFVKRIYIIEKTYFAQFEFDQIREEHKNVQENDRHDGRPYWSVSEKSVGNLRVVY